MLGSLARSSTSGLLSAVTARIGSLGLGPISRSTLASTLCSAPQQLMQINAQLSLLQQQQVRFMGKACLKTNKSAAKRFRVCGSGSIKRARAGMSHNTGYKAKDRKRRLGSSTGIKGKSIEQRMRRLIGA